MPAWITLLTTLVSFGLTLHLPAHFLLAKHGFQFEFSRPWIDSPAIFYHVGVDGLSLWLVVLVGLLAPIGVLASWNSIKVRPKIFYSLFLVQQTAMYGVFISLDLLCSITASGSSRSFPWRSSLPCMDAREGSRAAIKFFLFTFIPSALPLLVAILWLYARTGTFNFSELQLLIATGLSSCRIALLGGSGIPPGIRSQGSRISIARLARRHIQRSACCPRHGRRRQARTLLDAAFPCRPIPHAGSGNRPRFSSHSRSSNT